MKSGSRYYVAGVLAAIGAVGLCGSANAAGCPATPLAHLGSASGCLTITLNPGGTATLTNPAPGTSDVFDVPASEDALVLVVNSSGSTVNSLTLSSNLTIFRFDGDGTQANANGAVSNYSGPNTTFSNIAANFLSGTVNFTGGLATGATAFFGLEEAPTAASFTQVIVGVPGPVVGAGMPGLLAACAGFLAWRRRRRQAVA